MKMLKVQMVNFKKDYLRMRHNDWLRGAHSEHCQPITIHQPRQSVSEDQAIKIINLTTRHLFPELPTKPPVRYFEKQRL